MKRYQPWWLVGLIVLAVVLIVWFYLAVILLTA
jgi:hypothetical protein